MYYALSDEKTLNHEYKINNIEINRAATYTFSRAQIFGCFQILSGVYTQHEDITVPFSTSIFVLIFYRAHLEVVFGFRSTQLPTQ